MKSMHNPMTPSKMIKQATASHHVQIEGVMRVMSPDFTKAEYIDLLQKFYGFYLPLEERIEEFGTLPELDYLHRRKTSLLAADLAKMNVHELNKIPLMEDWFSPLSRASIFGILYVTEGSTLGGQVISRQLNDQLSVTPSVGCQFFSSYGAQVGPMWMQFQTLLNEQLARLKS